MFRLLFATAVFAVPAFLCCGSLATSDEARVATVAPLEGGQPAEAEAVVEPQAAAVVGADVMAGEVRWKVVEARELGNTLESDNQFIDPLQSSGKFILVRFEVENRGAEPEMFSGVKLVDGQGREFDNSSDAIMRVDEDACLLEKLNPNVAKTCVQVYELPADATGLKLKAHDLSMFGPEEVLIDLGL